MAVLVRVLWVLLAVSAGSAVARAEPCAVRVLRAPPEVAEAIDAWMKLEPPCTRALDIRVVEAKTGFYVSAQEASGRLRERLVPDPVTAAALVASWAADDGAPQPAPTQVEVNIEVHAPTPSEPSGAASMVAAEQPSRDRLLVDLAGTYSISEAGTSLRLGVDVFHAAGLAFGAVAVGQRSEWELDDSPALHTTALQLMARVAIDKTWSARVSLRAEAALGVQRITDTMNTVDVGVVGTAALTTGGWITESWRVRAGPMVERSPAVTFGDFTITSGLQLRLWLGLDRRF